MSDIDLESNVGDRDNYDMNDYSQDPGNTPGKFDNLIGDGPISSSAAKSFPDEFKRDKVNDCQGEGDHQEEAFIEEQYEEDDEQCYDEAE